MYDVVPNCKILTILSASQRVTASFPLIVLSFYILILEIKIKTRVKNTPRSWFLPIWFDIDTWFDFNWIEEQWLDSWHWLTKESVIWMNDLFIVRPKHTSRVNDFISVNKNQHVRSIELSERVGQSICRVGSY